MGFSGLNSWMVFSKKADLNNNMMNKPGINYNFSSILELPKQ